MEFNVDKPWCVIGRTAGRCVDKGTGPSNRIWFSSKGEALNHASDILRSQNWTGEVYVVKVEAVVRPARYFEIVELTGSTTYSKDTID